MHVGRAAPLRARRVEGGGAAAGESLVGHLVHTQDDVVARLVRAEPEQATTVLIHSLIGRYRNPYRTTIESSYPSSRSPPTARSLPYPPSTHFTLGRWSEQMTCTHWSVPFTGFIIPPRAGQRAHLSLYIKRPRLRIAGKILHNTEIFTTAMKPYLHNGNDREFSLLHDYYEAPCVGLNVIAFGSRDHNNDENNKTHLEALDLELVHQVEHRAEGELRQAMRCVRSGEEGVDNNNKYINKNNNNNMANYSVTESSY
uniref:Uncharacterized protein n=1 Tax=Pristionchus pacificus TaxID=54126 RepID=A0A2A6CH63_PRIPA|eukprot:PDM77564.1 hypothetical protein PRIPAC_34431 [Pristionchus pacificus]